MTENHGVGGSIPPLGTTISAGRLFSIICGPDLSHFSHRQWKGDSFVTIERRDGAASIEEYRGRDATWLSLRGWLDPDESGRQDIYGDQVKLDRIARLAAVVYVKLKL